MDTISIFYLQRRLSQKCSRVLDGKIVHPYVKDRCNNRD